MLNNSRSTNWLRPGRRIMLLLGVIAALGLFSSRGAIAAACEGDFPNPITDVCWNCFFPLQIGSISISFGQPDNGDPDPPFLCTCPAPPPIFIRPGVGMSFWEPARVAEVVRTPMCSPTLNGSVLADMPFVPKGTNYAHQDTSEQAFYHVHWFQYPVLSWVGMGISQGICFVPEPMDMQYATELDPLWDDDELAFLINPEAILFANPIAQAACVADSLKASVTKFGIDALFWCSGSQGSIYPLSGSHATHNGGVDSTLATVHKHVARMHRMGLAMDTSTLGAMCTNLPQPVLRKKQYKQQMLFPIPQTQKGYGFGAASSFWGAGKEFPYKGEDFSYLIWRKRTCCAF